MSDIKYGVLLVNLGTPSEPTPSAVRQFLKEFLSDKRVVDLPRLVWLPVLYGIILTFRPKKVALNYQRIWTEKGSPLMVNSLAQQDKLQKKLNKEGSNSFKVELAMTYGKPSIESAYTALKEWGADEVIVLPLYPQFSHTTTSSVLDQTNPLETEFGKAFKVISDYYKSPEYIDALAKSITPQLSGIDKLVISFHGIPKRYIKNGDPYQSQCEETARLLALKLNLSDEQWELAYQSRLGKEEWLKPYLDLRLAEMPAEGYEKILVVCPGFSSDCLETLEEIAIENKERFIESGGQQFEYISALNANDDHINMMASLLIQQTV
jgi:protoporphyrin/coproporphyrin ferrochelatase